MNRFKHLIADMTSDTLNEWIMKQRSDIGDLVREAVKQEIVDASVESVDSLKALVQGNTDQISENDGKVSEELKQVWLWGFHDKPDWNQIESLSHLSFVI